MRLVRFSYPSFPVTFALLASLGLATGGACSKESDGGTVQVPGTGGRRATGGRSGTGGASANGGSSGSGSGGATSSGGVTGSGSGGATGSGGAGDTDANTGNNPETEAEVGAGTPDAEQPDVASAPMCLSTVKAMGDGPLVDDFEDGDSVVLKRDSRLGTWQLFYDATAMVTGATMSGLPFKPVATGGNPGKALHMKGTDTKGWGAGVSIDGFAGPGCYDASVYKGVKLDIKGKAGQKAVLQVFTNRTRPPANSGPFVKTIDLDGKWQTITAMFDGLQAGWGDPQTFSATEIYSIGVAAFVDKGTPPDFDIWVDNVGFVQ
jgi:hypothetical protein